MAVAIAAVFVDFFGLTVFSLAKTLFEFNSDFLGRERNAAPMTRISERKSLARRQPFEVWPHPRLLAFSQAARIPILALMLVVFLLAACHSPGVKKAPRQSGKPAVQHLIWITFDALRADHLSLYGYPLETAPHLTRWAAQGIVFDYCVAQGVCTHVSTRAMSFGRYFHNLAPVLNGQSSSDLRSLPRMLADLGYYTALFSNHGGLLIRPEFAVVSDRGERPETAAAEEAADWLWRYREENTFLWLHLFAPHEPQPASGKRYEEFLFLRGKLALFPQRFLNLPPSPLNEERRIIADHMWASYDAAIGKSDEALDLLLGRLKDWGMLDRALVAISADHGQSLNDMATLYHGRMTWRGQARVPLILLPPPALKEKIGPLGSVKQIVRHIDLAPTFYEAAGGDAAPVSFDGVSLWRILDGTFDGNLPGFTDGVGNGLPCTRSWQSEQWVLWKYEGLPEPKYELFDLSQNHEETIDVKDSNQKIYLQLRSNLDEAPPPDETGDLKNLALPQDVMKRLKSLGYL